MKSCGGIKTDEIFNGYEFDFKFEGFWRGRLHGSFRGRLGLKNTQ
jgi:hypothetical protein